MMYATNEGEEFIESVFYPNGIDHSDENRKNRVPRFLWDPMIDDIFDKGMISLRFTGNLIQSSILEFLSMSQADFWKTYPKQSIDSKNNI